MGWTLKTLEIKVSSAHLYFHRLPWPRSPSLHSDTTVRPCRAADVNRLYYLSLQQTVPIMTVLYWPQGAQTLCVRPRYLSAVVFTSNQYCCPPWCFIYTVWVSLVEMLFGCCQAVSPWLKNIIDLEPVWIDFINLDRTLVQRTVCTDRRRTSLFLTTCVSL